MDKKDIKILIVDNMTYVRIMLEKMLREWGFAYIKHAENGEKAIETFKQFNPDIVILDLTLPKVNTLTLISLFLNLKRNTKIVVCGDTENSTSYSEAIEKGAVDFFVKPFTERVLMEKIYSVYEKIAAASNNQKNASTEEADITKKFDISLNSKKSLQIFDFSKTLDKISFIDLMQAIIACQMYNYKNIVLDFGNMSTLYIDVERLKKVKDAIERRGGKFCIISKNDELTKILARTELFEHIAKTLTQAEKRIS